MHTFSTWRKGGRKSGRPAGARVCSRSSRFLGGIGDPPGAVPRRPQPGLQRDVRAVCMQGGARARITCAWRLLRTVSCPSVRIPASEGGASEIWLSSWALGWVPCFCGRTPPRRGPQPCARCVPRCPRPAPSVPGCGRRSPSRPAAGWCISSPG